jgi:hypothetical protein
MILFHSTTEDAAASILREGFNDVTGTYMTGLWLTGVWVSNVPLDVNEGAKGNVLLRIALALPAVALSDFEVVEEGKGYREWVIPATLLNEHGSVKRVKDRHSRAVR